jgi:hypothetical protein
MASSYKRHKAGDIIWHSDENALIDMLRELEVLHHKLQMYRLLKASDIGVGVEVGRYKDLTPVLDRIVVRAMPIEYYTDRLSPPGGYVLTPPPVSFKEAYSTNFKDLTPLIYNVDTGYRILWNDVWQGKPSAYVYIYSDCWIVVWFEDLTFTANPDWDWDDVAVGVRIEVLDGNKYVHFIALEKDHLCVDKCCILIAGKEYCTGNLGGYQGPVRIAYETWIPLQ